MTLCRKRRYSVLRVFKRIMHAYKLPGKVSEWELHASGSDSGIQSQPALTIVVLFWLSSRHRWLQCSVSHCRSFGLELQTRL